MFNGFILFDQQSFACIMLVMPVLSHDQIIFYLFVGGVVVGKNSAKFKIC